MQRQNKLSYVKHGCEMYSLSKTNPLNPVIHVARMYVHQLTVQSYYITR